MRRSRAFAQGAPRFCLWPTDARQEIRAAGTRLRHLLFCASGRKPWSAANAGSVARAPKGWRARNRQSRKTRSACAIAVVKKMWDAQHNRNPMLLLRLFGLMLLRKAARELFGLLL